jgi:hypothetical protein
MSAASSICSPPTCLRSAQLLRQQGSVPQGHRRPNRRAAALLAAAALAGTGRKILQDINFELPAGAGNASFFGHGTRDFAWLFPSVEVFRLLALGPLEWAVVLVNLSRAGISL